MRQIIAGSLLFASLLFPVAAKATQPVEGAADVSTTRMVSTGITAPQLLQTASYTLPEGYNSELVKNGTQVRLSLVVDEKGRPQHIQILSGSNQFVNASVVSAVNQFRFRPATIDNRTIPMEMNLTVTVQNDNR